jgi:hypothetical protein
MKVAICACLFAKRDMNVNACHAAKLQPFDAFKKC